MFTLWGLFRILTLPKIYFLHFPPILQSRGYGYGTELYTIHIGKKQLNLMKIRTFCFFLQTQSGSGGLVVSSDEKKREELRWFPADNISDCDAEPGLEQVRDSQLINTKPFAKTKRCRNGTAAQVGFGTSEKEEELLENETRQKTYVPAKFIKGERGQAEPCLSRRRGTFLLVRES